MAYTKTYTDSASYPIHVVRNGVTLNSTNRIYTSTGSRSGQSVPGFREIIRAGGNASSPYTLENSKLLYQESGNASAFGRGPIPVNPGGARGYLSEQFTGFVPYESTDITHLSVTAGKAEAIALTQIYRKIESEQSHLAGASTLAEGVDVLRQFGKPFNALVDLTNRRLNRLALESRGLKGTIAFRRVKWAQIVASTYLEYAFGLAPLIEDTRKTAEAYARWQLEAEKGLSQLRSKAVGRGESETASSTVTNMRAGSSNTLEFAVHTRTVTKEKVQYVCGLKATPIADLGSNDRLIQLLGFEPRKWVPAIWEVVPWSFLIDYCTNVQNILEAASANVSGVTWISRTVTKQTTREVEATFKKAFAYQQLSGYNAAWDQNVTGTHGGRYKRVRTTMARTVPAALGVPPLVVDFNLNTKQLTNIFALLVSRKPSSSAMWLY